VVAYGSGLRAAPDEDPAFEVGLHCAAGEVRASDERDLVVDHDDLQVQCSAVQCRARATARSASDLRPTVTRTVREIESTTPAALCRPERRGQLIVGPGP
jgi:hypothetical protein